MRCFLKVTTILSLWTLTATSGLAQPLVQKVAEMNPLPLAVYGQLNASCEVSSREQAAWGKTFSFATSLVDDDTVIELSRSADKALGNYHYQAGAPTDLTLYGCNDKYKIYETTLDELPSAHSAVRRYLKEYIVGLNQDDAFLPNVIILTIRGERLE